MTFFRPDSRHAVVVVPPFEEADPFDPAECEDVLSLLGGAYEHVSAIRRADGFVEHLWKCLARYPPVLRGRVQVCRSCKKVVFHVFPIDLCSTACGREEQ